MKYRLMLFAMIQICCVQFLKSQDYSIVKLGKNYFFYKNASILAVNVDSVKIINSDTIYYHYLLNRNPEYNLSGCYDIHGGSLYGKRNIYTSDGKFMIFNKMNDTIFIYPNADLNSSWTFFRWSNQDLHIQASITEISNQVIFGETDEVKTISLLVKNSLNQNFDNHPLNKKILFLSKSYGLINTFDFYKFPLDTLQYSIFDIYDASERVSRLNKQIFDFEIGDEFHTQSLDAAWYSNQSGPYMGDGFKKNTIKKVIAKHSPSPNTSISYTFERCEMVFNYNNGIVDTTYLHDTIVETIIYEHITDSVLIQFPWQSYHTSSYIYNHVMLEHFYDYQYNNRIRYRYEDRVDVAFVDTCWQFVNLDPQAGYTNYINGVGGPYYRFEIGMYTVNIKENKLKFYKKGDETWGTPIAPNCMSLINSIEENRMTNSGINIYPTPCSSSFFIDFLNFEDTQVKLEIFSLSGKLEYSEKITSKSTKEISTQHLSSGVYLAKVSGGNHNIVSKIVICK